MSIKHVLSLLDSAPSVISPPFLPPTPDRCPLPSFPIISCKSRVGWIASHRQVQRIVPQ
jgi:hypothetical protein